MTEKGWETYAHPADIGIRRWGRTKAQAFEQAAIALISIITDTRKIYTTETRQLTLEDPDPELLFYEWISNVVSFISAEGLIFSRFDVSIENETLTAELKGEKLDIEKHNPGLEVKAATYADLKVEHKNNKWLAQCIVDV